MLARTNVIGLSLIAAVLSPGCGAETSSIAADAAAADAAAADAAAADAPAEGLVTVTTYRGMGLDGGLWSGADVIAIDPDGTSRTTTTAADGTATIDVVGGGSVVALYPDQFDGVFEVHAVLGVEPGDALIFGDDRVGIGAEIGTMTIAAPAVAGASTYSVSAPCGLSSPFSALPVTIRWYEGCGASQDLVVVAKSSTARVLAYATLDDVMFEDAGSASVSAWQAPTNLFLSVSGLDDAFLNADFAVTGDHGQFVSMYPPIDTSGGGAGTILAWAPVGDTALARVRLNSYEGSAGIADVIDADATAHTFAAPPLPSVTDVAAAPGATMTVTTDGAYAFDSSALTMEITDASLGVTRWRITAPPLGEGETTIALPALPAPFDSLNFSADDEAGQLDALLNDWVDVDGYAEARQRSASTPSAGIRWVLGSN